LECVVQAISLKQCQHRKEIKTITSYTNTMTVTDIFPKNTNMPEDKTSTVIARGSTVVSALIARKKKSFNSCLPSLFVFKYSLLDEDFCCL
jgi:hypothetical protein